MRRTAWHAAVALAAALVLASCASLRPEDPHPKVALQTTMGRIVVELDGERAPVTTRNFVRYVREGHYDGTIFHRVVENFVVQGGGHLATMVEKPTHEAIPNEARNGLSNRAGTIAMAREPAIDSATAQFFINVVDNPRLDHVDVPPQGITVSRNGKDTFVTAAQADTVFGYAVFGRVVEGMDVVERMRHVAVHAVRVGEDTYENVPVQPITIEKAAILPQT